MQLEHDNLMDLIKLQLLVFDHGCVLLHIRFHLIVKLIEQFINSSEVHITLREKLLQNTCLTNLVNKIKCGTNFV